ncbi:MAG: hypothetical protein COU46_01800 [Candidatus Niyogibacteria bacterium CG10_big_fil_rev_8_21_14_0_10_42_19]|uniref:VWFA domain-containing protein n=1 Tax=Candidatus Niyogibacteria bacterium CG10_big_fil_rev_8_21_14_0_10_42_19 TaxID=1974725 RepID=A0A2H0TFN9_9BACT|nr:MAG: hypothetical protein COU46_01800 [Candidatus Niyogibacteria bacterium CG10_big_fil_rev_8_21_14_0_10_42_19]
MALVFASLSTADIKIPKKADGATYVFVFDITLSQMIEDYYELDGKKISRIKLAKKTFFGILDNLPKTSSVSILAFSGEYFDTLMVILPPTPVTDRALIKNQLQLVDWWNAWNDSSSLELFPIYFLNQTRRWEKPLNVVMFGDGGGNPVSLHDDDGEESKLEAELREYFESGFNFLFIGVGKNFPSEVPVFNKEGEKAGCLINKFENDICYVSALNEETLRLSAEAFGAKYLNIEDGKDIQKWISSPIVRPESANIFIPLSWIFGVISLTFFVLWVII